MLSTQLSSNIVRPIVHTETVNTNPLRIVIDQTKNEIRMVAKDLFVKVLSNIFLYNEFKKSCFNLKSTDKIKTQYSFQSYITIPYSVLINFLKSKNRGDYISIITPVFERLCIQYSIRNMDEYNGSSLTLDNIKRMFKCDTKVIADTFIRLGYCTRISERTFEVTELGKMFSNYNPITTGVNKGKLKVNSWKDTERFRFILTKALDRPLLLS